MGAQCSFVVREMSLHTKTDLTGIGWKPPLQGWAKLNTDGAVSLVRRKAACGRVLSDHTRPFIVGFLMLLESEASWNMSWIKVSISQRASKYGCVI